MEKANEVFTRERKSARAPSDIWLPFLMLATCLFVLDVAVRRLMWGESELQNLSKSARKLRDKRSTPRAKPEAPKRDASMERLRRAKRSTQSMESEAPSTPVVESSPEPSTPVTEEDEELDAMERLRRAKREAR